MSLLFSIQNAGPFLLHLSDSSLLSVPSAYHRRKDSLLPPTTFPIGLGTEILLLVESKSFLIRISLWIMNVLQNAISISTTLTYYLKEPRKPLFLVGEKNLILQKANLPLLL